MLIMNHELFYVEITFTTAFYSIPWAREWKKARGFIEINEENETETFLILTGR